jgi:hypothetical protein
MGPVGNQGQGTAFNAQQSHNFKIGEPAGSAGQGIDQMLGLTAGRSDKYALTGFDMFQGLIGAGTFLNIIICPINSFLHIGYLRFF